MRRLNQRIASAVTGLGLLLVSTPARAQTGPSSGSESAAAINQTAGGSGDIRGTVMDEGRRPLSGVMVSALGSKAVFAVTDAEGRFTMSALPPGPYLVRAHHEGFVASRREIVEVRSRTATTYEVKLRPSAIATSGGRADPAVIAAGFVTVPIEPESASTADAPEMLDEAPPHDHSELAWRIRRIRRTVLKDQSGYVDLASLEPADRDAGVGSVLGRAVENSARLAANFLTDFPFSGQLNILTTGAFDHTDGLFDQTDGPRGVAYVSIGSSVGDGRDWRVQGAVTEGDVSSWIVAGSYAARLPSTHAFDIGMSYSTQRYDGGNPAALRAVTDGSRNAGAVHAYDYWTISPHVALSYGGRYARYDYLDGPGLFSPIVGLTLMATDRTRARVNVSQRMLAPGAEEFLPPPVSGLWLPPERTFAPLAPDRQLRAERARTLDVALEHDLNHAYAIGVRRFPQRVDNQLITIFGVVVPETPRTDIGHYYVANLGRADIEGWGVDVSGRLAERLRGSVEYTLASARWRPSPEESTLVAASVPSGVRLAAERFHDISATVEARVPETSTRLVVICRLNSAYPSGDPTVNQPIFDRRYGVQINQALPFLPMGGSHWELLLAVRNLFREPLDGGSAYDEVLVVRPPKRIVGGVLVRF
jgi:hypothetical protein